MPFPILAFLPLTSLVPPIIEFRRDLGHYLLSVSWKYMRKNRSFFIAFHLYCAFGECLVLELAAPDRDRRSIEKWLLLFVPPSCTDLYAHDTSCSLHSFLCSPLLCRIIFFGKTFFLWTPSFTGIATQSRQNKNKTKYRGTP